MSGRDANQLAADAVQRLRALIPAEGFHYAWCNARPCTCEAQYDREALDEVVGLVHGGNCIRGDDGKSPCERLEALVGTLQQERDDLQDACRREREARHKMELRRIAESERAEAAEAALAEANQRIAELESR